MAWQLYDSWGATRDGNWTTFKIRVGTPPQVLPALVSADESWLSLPFGESPECRSTVPGQPLHCSTDQYLKAQEPLYLPRHSSTIEYAQDCSHVRYGDFLDDGAPGLHEGVLGQKQFLGSLVFAGGRDRLLWYTATVGMMAVWHQGFEFPWWSKEPSLYTLGPPQKPEAMSLLQSLPSFHLSEREHPLRLVRSCPQPFILSQGC